jgi:hypothetical protein
LKSRLAPDALALHYFLSGSWLWLTFNFLWKDAGVLFLLLFVIGAAWLLAVVYHTFEGLKYGEVELSIAGPVHPGGKLVALVSSPGGFAGARTLTATLQCKRMFWHDGPAGNRRSLTPGEELVWSREARFPVSAQRGAGRCRIEFEIPADARATVPASIVLSDRSIVQDWQKSGFHWQVDLRADIQGVDLMRSFPVTVAVRP